MAKAAQIKPATMEDILDRQITDFEAPKPLPPGEYTFVVDGQPRQDKSTKQQTPFVEYACRPIAAMDTVDEEALAEAGGLEKKRLRLTFYLTDDAAYRLRNFLQNTLELDVEGMSIGQAIGEAAGCQFVGTVRHTTSKDGERTFAEITDTAPVA